MSNYSYQDAMEKEQAFLTVTLDLTDPIEIGDFAAHFAGMSAEFDRYIANERPELKGQARIYIEEVRKGSIVSVIFPIIGDMIGMMDSALIVGGFASLFSKRVRHFISGGFLDGAKKPELKNIHDSIQAVAQDRDGKIEIAENTFVNGKIVTQTVFRMTSDEAKTARDAIERQKEELDRETRADHSRVYGMSVIAKTLKRVNLDPEYHIGLLIVPDIIIEEIQLLIVMKMVSRRLVMGMQKYVLTKLLTLNRLKTYPFLSQNLRMAEHLNKLNAKF